MKTGVKTILDRKDALYKAFKAVAKDRVLVGIPADHAARDAGDKSPINNAQIGYLMEFGVPEMNIPARPHLIPGVKAAIPKIKPILKGSITKAINGNLQQIPQALGRVGQTAVSSVTNLISEGIAPPLSERTLIERAERKGGSVGGRRKGAKAELAARAAGEAPSLDYAKPLIDTGAYLASIDFVIAPAKSVKSIRGGK